MNKSKREILSSALSCFMEQGVENTTIADIRDRSGISVGSIYHHFGNKEGIVVALFLSGVEDHSRIQERALADVETAEAGVKTVVRCYINWINDHPDWARFVFRYRSLVENSTLAEESESQRKAHFKRLRHWFRPYIEQFEIQALSFEVYYSLIIGPSQVFALRWLAGKTRASLIEQKELFAEAAWQAVKT